MGDAADDLYFQELRQEMAWENAWRELRKKQWRQKGGETVHVSQMETSHINNCIAMLERNIAADHNAHFAERWLGVLGQELSRRQVKNNLTI